MPGSRVPSSSRGAAAIPPTDERIASDRSLAEIVLATPAAARVLRDRGLDFCCAGRRSLAAACAARGLELERVLAELDRAAAGTPPEGELREGRPLPDLIEHVLSRFHAPHRAKLPHLARMARSVEAGHAHEPSCPRGLAAQVRRLAEELELHMLKEEQVLFPLALGGQGSLASMPIRVMEVEHEDVAELLAAIRRIARGFVAPAEAGATWRALYHGLSELELELMRHVHFENHVLFPRILQGGSGRRS